MSVEKRKLLEYRKSGVFNTKWSNTELNTRIKFIAKEMISNFNESLIEITLKEL